MSRRLRGLPRVLLSGLALPLALCQLSACNCNKSGGGGEGAAAGFAPIDSRMPGPVFEELSSPAGFIDGGLGYIAFKPGVAQKWLQGVPMPSDLARDVARAGDELGVDLRSGDVLTHFGVDPEGVVSMTLGRPLLGDGEALFDEMANVPPPKPDAFPGDGDNSANVPPALASRVGAVGFHFRVHVPILNSEPFARELKRLPPDGKLNAPICAELQPNVLCAADAEALVLVREMGKALVGDVFLYPAKMGSISDAERRPAIDAALKIEKGSAPVTLSGDAAGYVDATKLREFATVVSVGDTARSLRWSDAVGERVERERRALKALDNLRATRLLLRGARYEVAISDEAIRSTFSWEPTDAEAAKTLETMLSHTGLALDAPSIDGLCSNSLVCFRSGGLPSLDALSELATGIYAAPVKEFGRVMDDADDFGPLVIALETWPNVLGAAKTWPQQEARGPEAAIISQVMGALDNFAGAGGSLRSLMMPKGRGVPALDFVGYMRVSGAEIGIVRGMLALAGQRLNPVEIEGVSGKVESLAIPEEVQASLFMITDEKTAKVGDRDVEVGWMAAADGVDRITWLLGLDRESSIEPAVYFEIPDLTRLIASVPEAEREIGTFRAWLAGKSVRFAADVVDGRPRFDSFFGKVPGAAKAE